MMTAQKVAPMMRASPAPVSSRKLSVTPWICWATYGMLPASIRVVTATPTAARPVTESEEIRKGGKLVLLRQAQDRQPDDRNDHAREGRAQGRREHPIPLRLGEADVAVVAPGALEDAERQHVHDRVSRQRGGG